MQRQFSYIRHRDLGYDRELVVELPMARPMRCPSGAELCVFAGGHLALLLSGSFVRLALVAIVIAFPIAWWAMHRWLADLAYRTAIGWWVFVAAGLLVMVITLATVSIQAMRTEMLDPVKNLKVE
jgi:hypothetical protein